MCKQSIKQGDVIVWPNITFQFLQGKTHRFDECVLTPKHTIIFPCDWWNDVSICFRLLHKSKDVLFIDKPKHLANIQLANIVQFIVPWFFTAGRQALSADLDPGIYHTFELFWYGSNCTTLRTLLTMLFSSGLFNHICTNWLP